METKLSNSLIELRKKSGFTQQQIAEKLNVTPQAVSRWEKGDTAPDVDTLIKLSNIYNISLDKLIKNEEPVVAVVPDNRPQKPESVKQNISSDEILDEKEKEIVNTYNKMNETVYICRRDTLDYVEVNKQDFYLYRLSSLKKSGIIHGVICALALAFFLYVAFIDTSDTFLCGCMAVIAVFVPLGFYANDLRVLINRGNIIKLKNVDSKVGGEVDCIENNLNDPKTIVTKLFEFIFMGLVHSIIGPVLFVIYLVKYIKEVNKVKTILK